MSGPIDLATLKGMAADRTESLCRELFPAGVREGAEWRVGSLTGEPGRSMAVHLGGARAGVWSDFSSGESGDVIDLVAAALFRGDKPQAIKWLWAWLGLDGADPIAFEQHRRQAEQRRQQSQHADDRRRSWTTKTFLAARPSLAGTPAADYLAGRGIDLQQLGRQPRALRLSALWNEETRRHWPALVAAIVNADGRIVAVHRTWLAPGGSGKAPLRDPKKALGRYAGGSIRLWRGASGKPLKEAPDGDTILISEGIEDGLSCALAAPELRVVAAVSLANMGAIVLPPAIRTVIIAAQNDPPNSPAAKALERAAASFLRQRRRVKIARPPEGKDMNDLLRSSGAA